VEEKYHGHAKRGAAEGSEEGWAAVKGGCPGYRAAYQRVYLAGCKLLHDRQCREGEFKNVGGVLVQEGRNVNLLKIRGEKRAGVFGGKKKGRGA